jgi:hypothetical protein
LVQVSTRRLNVQTLLLQLIIFVQH